VTGAEALLRLEDLGARVELAPDGTIRAELPVPEPAALSLFIAELKAHRDDAIRFLQARDSSSLAGEPPRSCYRCDAPLGVAADLLCPRCFSARRPPGRVLPFDPDARRRRNVARLARRRCGDCGTVNWMVTERGDAVCRTCAAARREEA
jgi:hypothetical protein